MEGATFSGGDPIHVIEVLQMFKIACDQTGFSEAAAMCLFQFYVQGYAYYLIQGRLKSHAMTTEGEEDEIRNTYSRVIRFLLQTYSSEAFIEEAH